MTETLFSFDKRNYRECQQMFRGARDQEYYRGDFWIEDASNVEVRSERKTVGAISIIKQRSATNLFFRRTRQHIREVSLGSPWHCRHTWFSFCHLA